MISPAFSRIRSINKEVPFPHLYRMSDLNASLYHLHNTQSVAFKFFSDSVKQIEREINSTVDLNFFTNEQIDFIVLICDQFQKLVKLRSKSKLIDNLLTYNFPELFKSAENRNVPSPPEPARSQTVEPISKGTENQYKFVCDICDEDVPILNDDLNYSTQSHLSSPYHLEVVSILRKIKESETCASSVASSSLNSTLLNPQYGPPKVGLVLKNVPNGSKFAPPIVSNSKTTPPSQPSKSSPVPNTISKEEESFQRSAWIQSQRQNQYLLWRRSQYYCCLCDAYLPTPHNFDAHVRGFTHKTNVAAEKCTANANVGTSQMGNISGDNKHNSKNRVITPTRSTSSDNQSGKSQVRTPTRSTNDNQSSQIIVNKNGVRVCTICNVRLPSEANFVSHTSSVSHRTKSELFEKTFNTLTKALDDVTTSAASSSRSTLAANVKSNAVKNETSNAFQDFLVTRDGAQYCRLCNVKVPGKPQQDSHFNGSLHKKQLQTATTKSVSKPFTDVIITKDKKWYCILCNSILPGESQLTEHKNGKLHRQKLKKYEEKYPS